LGSRRESEEARAFVAGLNSGAARYIVQSVQEFFHEGFQFTPAHFAAATEHARKIASAHRPENNGWPGFSMIDGKLSLPMAWLALGASVRVFQDCMEDHVQAVAVRSSRGGFQSCGSTWWEVSEAVRNVRKCVKDVRRSLVQAKRIEEHGVAAEGRWENRARQLVGRIDLILGSHLDYASDALNGAVIGGRLETARFLSGSELAAILDQVDHMAMPVYRLLPIDHPIYRRHFGPFMESEEDALQGLKPRTWFCDVSVGYSESPGVLTPKQLDRIGKHQPGIRWTLIDGTHDRVQASVLEVIRHPELEAWRGVFIRAIEDGFPGLGEGWSKRTQARSRKNARTEATRRRSENP
jgi:hypothetical protein